MYTKELQILRKNNLLREKKLYQENKIDFSSNDYLGLSKNKTLLKEAFRSIKKLSSHSPKSSMVVSGYSALHLELEKILCEINGFDDGVILGSGFLANIALFDTLVRKNDIIFIDDDYHASGKYPAQILGKRAVYFKHNDPQDLREKIASNKTKGRILIAIEGVYSMRGDIASSEFASIALEKDAILIVDEAHSDGCIGENLLGYFDYYNIKIETNFIKMGTLSKSYASYGAYILANKSVIDFLVTRAKSIIYTTALSLFDTALAIQNVNYIHKNRKSIKSKLDSLRKIINKSLDTDLKTSILVITFENQEQMLLANEILSQNGFCVGAIRKPTVEKALLRITIGTKTYKKQILNLCKILQKLKREWVNA